MIFLSGESTLVLWRMQGFVMARWWEHGLPKKVLQWAGPGQDAVPCSLSRHFENLFSGFPPFTNTHGQSDMKIIIRNNIDSRPASCVAKKSRVEGTRCRNLRAAALQCRQSSAIGTTMRTSCRTDAVCLCTFYVIQQNTAVLKLQSAR